MKYKVMIVDDHSIFREGFKLIMKYVKNAELIGEATNGEEFLDMLQKNKPDIVFMDINMPRLDGFGATEKALELFPDLRIIAITSADSIEHVNRMLNAGVAGYMLKDAEYTEVEQAIASVMSDRNFFSPQILVALTQTTMNRHDEEKKKEALPKFTEREFEVLEYLCNGLSKKEIAEKMFLSERTIEKYKEKLMSKTNTNSSVSLVVYAMKNKIVEYG